MKASLPYEIWQKQTGEEFVIAAFLSAEDGHRYLGRKQIFPGEDVSYFLKYNGKVILTRTPLGVS